ncbi:DUF397 domain-containing protein [Streptomyces sp. NPDC057654]|uniref:DUF397 domain-containing protein n=1 Tax=Streptomyces sp. NPDC057654 TaxID=3346196 RepID=UPI0036B38DDD
MPVLDWQKSSYSADASACLYLASAPDGAIHLRESDAPGVTLSVRPEVLRTLISAIKTGGFAAGSSHTHVTRTR